MWLHKSDVLYTAIKTMLSDCQNQSHFRIWPDTILFVVVVVLIMRIRAYCDVYLVLQVVKLLFQSRCSFLIKHQLLSSAFPH